MKDVSDLRGRVGRGNLGAFLEKCLDEVELPAAVNVESEPDLEAILQERRFYLSSPPPAVVPRFKLGDATICTPGNLTGIQAQAKGGKTAIVCASIAATMSRTGACLSISADNSKGFAVIHLDTEQSPADHYAVGFNATRRAGIKAQPHWLYSYNLTDLPLARRREIIPLFWRRQSGSAAASTRCS